MNTVTILWEIDARTSIQESVKCGAAFFYLKKGIYPTICLLNPDTIGLPKIKGFVVRPDPSVPQGHIRLCVEELSPEIAKAQKSLNY